MKKKKTAKAKKTKTKPKAKAKLKAKSKAKPKAKASAKPKAKLKTKPAHKKAPKKASKGLSVIELFQMKKEREQAAQDPEAWKHKKDLPPQDQPHQEAADISNNGKKSGFGGARHH